MERIHRLFIFQGRQLPDFIFIFKGIILNLSYFRGDIYLTILCPFSEVSYEIYIPGATVFCLYLYLSPLSKDWFYSTFKEKNSIS